MASALHTQLATFTSIPIGRISRDLAGGGCQMSRQKRWNDFVRFTRLPTRTIQHAHSSHFRAQCLLSRLLIVIANLCRQPAFAYFVYFLVKTRRPPFNVSSSTTLCRNQADERIYTRLCPTYRIVQEILSLSSYWNTILQAEITYPSPKTSTRR